MYNNELQTIVNKRLNISAIDDNNESISKFKYLKSIDFQYSEKDNNNLIISNRLYSNIKAIIKNEYSKSSKTIIKNRLEQALFFVSLIFNNLYFNEEIDLEKVFKRGVLISKDMIINFIPIKTYYEIKKILLVNKIISEIDMSIGEKTIQYSKKLKLSKLYILNETFKYKIKIVKIKSKHISKFLLFKRNGFLFGNKQRSFKNNYLPFDSDQKNIQYLYQKQMFFDDSFFEVIKSKYPNYENYVNNFNSNEGKYVRKMLSFYKSLNSHVFSSSEAYGRIYLPFHYIPSEYRDCIRIGNNEKLFEVFDIKCCFVFLSAKIIKKQTTNKILKDECNNIIQLTQDDIYKDILKYNNILYTNENRKKLKSYVMKWLFSNLQDRRIVISSSIDMQYIDSYFKNMFPLFYNEIIFYKTRTFYKLTNENIIVKSEKSDLPYSCFEYESNIMFNHVLPYLNSKFKNIPFISLHDAIFIPERFLKNAKTIKRSILTMINKIE